MNWEEFSDLTARLCPFCESEFDCEVATPAHTRFSVAKTITATEEKLQYTCKGCKKIKAIFKSTDPKPLIYFSMVIEADRSQVVFSRANEKTNFLVSINSNFHNIALRSPNIWIMPEYKVKSKIESLMLLK